MRLISTIIDTSVCKENSSLLKIKGLVLFQKKKNKKNLILQKISANFDKTRHKSFQIYLFLNS